MRYVALGDSFVSGPGIPNQRPDDCTRSDKNFPSLIAAELTFTSFTDASCGGAQTTHYWNAQGTNPPQLDALRPDTTLVTLGTMGGNDAGLVQLAVACLSGGCSELPVEPYHQTIDGLADVYRDLIDDVRERSPYATIVAVGYGTYVPHHTCPALGNASDADLVYLQDIIDRLSDTIETVAAQEDIAFVDMRTIEGWRDHTACAAPESQWIRGLVTYGDGAPLHPSTAGMAQMAAKALETIAPLVPEPTEPTPTPTVPTPKPTTKPKPVPTSAERVAKAAKTVRIRAVCTGPRSKKRVVLRASGGQGLVKMASFRVGRTWVGTDRKAPFGITRKASTIKKSKNARGPVRVTVVLRHGKVARVKDYTTKRPGCLR